MSKSGYRKVPLEITQVRESEGETFTRVFDARKGRGAVSNIQGRYEVEQRVGFDDGWGAPESENGEEEPATVRTIITEETAKTIISRNKSPDLPFNVSLNPYRGCEHVIFDYSVCDYLLYLIYFNFK